MRRIGRAVVSEYNQLLLLTALNNLRRAGIQFRLDLSYDWQDEWSQKGEDKDVDLLLNVLNEIRQDWNLLNSFGN